MTTDSSSIRMLPEIASESVATAKSAASEIIADWPSDASFNAEQILADHPEFRRCKSIVLDFAYEEYCRSIVDGEKIAPAEFAVRFHDVQKSLLHLIEVHNILHENPRLIHDQRDLPWPKAGESFLDLELIEELGRGAFSRVFLAIETNLGERLVVAKIGMIGSREAKVLGRLEHPHIVPVLSEKTDESRDLSAICMPYFGRTTLLDVIDVLSAEKTLPAKPDRVLETIAQIDGPDGRSTEKQGAIRRPWRGTFIDAMIDVGIQLASGLEFAHKRGICHGDIKPSNVLMNPDGRAMLMDFNLSFETRGEDRAKGGTLPYMAPEQLLRVAGPRNGDTPPTNEQSDLYALGVVLYELFTGRHPFGTVNPEDSRKQAAERLIEKQKNGPRPLREWNRAVDRKLARHIEKCLAFDQAQRWQSAAELQAALHEELALTKRCRRWGWSHRKAVAAALLAAGLSVSGVVYALATQDPLDVRLMKQGQRAFQQQRYDEAARSFEQLLAISPDSTDALFLLGRSHMLGGRYQDAFNVFEDCEKITPDDRRTIACKGHCIASLVSNSMLPRQRSHNFKIAIIDYQRALGDSRLSEAALHNNIGYCYYKLNERELAEKSFRKAVDLNDRLQPALYYLAILNRNSARKEKNYELLDLSYIRRAIACNPEEPFVNFEAACIYAAAANDESLGREGRDRLVETCLEHCRSAVSNGLPPQKLDAVTMFYPPLREIGEFQNLKQKASPTSSTLQFDGLIDPLRRAAR